MNDLFARLAARAADDVPLLRPRPVSRFAAPASPPRFDGITVPAPAGPLQTERIQPVGSVERPVAPPQLHAVAGAAASLSPPRAAGAAIPPVDAAARAAVAPRAAATSAPPASASAVEPQRPGTVSHAPVESVKPGWQVSAAGAEPLAATAVGASPDVLRQHVARDRVAPGNETAVADVPRAVDAVQRAVADAHREVGGARPDANAAPLLRVTGPSPVAVFGASAAAASPASAPAAPAAPDEQPPVVEITIGRIDVRAVQPEAPARKLPQRPARLGLDEYLRRRPGAP